MKLFAFLLVLGCYSFNASAQQDELLKKKLWDEYKKNRSLIESPKAFKPRSNITQPFLVPQPEALPKTENKMMVLKLPLKGFYEGTNGTVGEIYSMQPDNMPCLVPGKSFKSNMPVVKSEGTPDFQLQLDRSPNKQQEKNDDGVAGGQQQ